MNLFFFNKWAKVADCVLHVLTMLHYIQTKARRCFGNEITWVKQRKTPHTRNKTTLAHAYRAVWRQIKNINKPL
jgi:hypothetical protein